jgi:hypothetical protein
MMEELKPQRSSIVDEVMTSDLYAMTGAPLQSAYPVQTYSDQQSSNSYDPQMTSVQDQQAENQEPEPPVSQPVQHQPEANLQEIQPTLDFFNVPSDQEIAEEQIPEPPAVEPEVPPAPVSDLKTVEGTAEEAVHPMEKGVQEKPPEQPPATKLPPVDEPAPKPAVEERESRIDDLFD